MIITLLYISQSGYKDIKNLKSSLLSIATILYYYIIGLVSNSADGGAPKGNQNARKKQPLNVDVNKNENNDDVNVNADGIHTPTPPNTPTNSRELKTSYGSSTTNTLGKFENNNERLEGETTPTPHHQDTNKGELNIGEYMRTCLMNNITALVEVRKGMRPQDDLLFWRTISLYKDFFNVADDKTAIKEVNSMVDDIIKQSR